MKNSFDVFLSHNSRDKVAVVKLAKILETLGVKPWLDLRELVPGRPWQEAVEAILETIPAVAVLLGQSGQGSWQKREIRAFLEEFVRRDLPVIPVLLPGAPSEPELPVFLRGLTWVDLRDGFNDRDMERLVWGIKATHPRYASAGIRDLSQRLEEAYQRRAELESNGEETAAINEAILDLRRRIRDGGQLKAGDFLAGRFKLLEMIGHGGFAQVWRAYDSGSRTVVAAKVLYPQYAHDRTRRERFTRGAWQMARIDHPRVVRVVHEPREDEGYLFFVMEYLGGADLRRAVLEKRLSPIAGLRAIVEVGKALQVAHDRGIIHRDVKPANILLDTAGRPKLTDFDLVRATDTTGGTRTGMLGTLVYAAPEVMEKARDAQESADVYGLGMTAVFVLYGDDLPLEVMRGPAEFVARLGLRGELRTVLEHAVAWNIDRRPRSIEEFCLALEKCLESEGPLFDTARGGAFISREVENDGFDRLMFSAGISAREVILLRALGKFLLLSLSRFGQRAMEQALVDHAEIVRLLVALFRGRFDSASTPEAELALQIESQLAEVTAESESRVLRHFYDLVRATLRTNYFQRRADGGDKPHISFKFDSRRIPCLPKPRPFREIFVYSPRFEAVHLRDGRVGRGGLRRCERWEDLRTEAVELMKAQTVKNAGIVPVGAMATFVLKRLPDNQEDLVREESECCQAMMRGIFDLTDNVVGDRVVPPRGVVRHDDDDPYLLVIADRDTPFFAPVQVVAREYGFWLADAFASVVATDFDAVFDRQINIGMLLDEVEATGKMTRGQRVELLGKMADEVADQARRDHHIRTRAITLAYELRQPISHRMAQFIRDLEKTGRFERAIELPGDDVTLADRMQRGEGLTRSETAALFSCAEMELHDELLDSDLSADPYLEEELRRYFPEPLGERYPERILSHRLRREIVAHAIAAEIVHRMGVTSLRDMVEETSMEVGQIVRAYVISREICGAREIWCMIDELGNRVPAAALGSMLANCRRLVRSLTGWFLREESKPFDIPSQVERYAEGPRRVEEHLGTQMSLADRKRLAKQVDTYLAQGVPEKLAARAARLVLLVSGCDLVRIADDTEVDIAQVAAVYFAVGSRFGFTWLRRTASRLPVHSAWDERAIATIVADLHRHQSTLTRRVVESAVDMAPVGPSAIDFWTRSHHSSVLRSEQLLAEVRSVTSPDLAMLAVVTRQFKLMSA